MNIIRLIVLGATITWVMRQLFVTRKRLRTGQIVIPPLFAATLVFLLCIFS